MECSTSSVQQGHWWTLLTYAFVHGSPIHLLLNLFALTLMQPVEDIIGKSRTAVYYLLGCLAGSLAHIGRDNIPMVGASAGICTMAALFVMFLPQARILFMFIPIRAWIGGIAFLVISVIGLFGHSMVGHDAHLAGVFVGITAFYAMRVPRPVFEQAPKSNRPEIKLLPWIWVGIALFAEINNATALTQDNLITRVIYGPYLLTTLLLCVLNSAVTWPARSLMIWGVLLILYPTLGIEKWDSLVSMICIGWAIGLLTIKWINHEPRTA